MKLTYTPVYFLLILFQYCSNRPDMESDKKALLALHQQQRKAHLDKNVSLLLGDSTLTDYIEVNRGLIKRPSYSESAKRFQAYFDEVEFIQWDDVTPPVFSFSDDGTMATAVVDKIVITRPLRDNRPDTAYYAWLAVYKKIKGKWVLHRMGSTNK